MFVKSVDLTSLVLDTHFLQNLAKPWQDGGEAHQICVCVSGRPGQGTWARVQVSGGRGQELSLVADADTIHDLQERLGAL